MQRVWRRRSESNRRIKVLQTSALPLGYAACIWEEEKRLQYNTGNDPWRAVARIQKLERETGFEPATSTLARLHSTTELFPLPA